ncbi:hypothetical protein B0H16DRAFT_1575282 [Mycena metata]|uniref:F-box domain-containing protein n=1 Tax=Mycena metata TaxID=1033252 RepID=A0AAD7I5X0_9AGAR|nr:hypothetical protein B0H16DRAFT_1575282 [Mycena metata]
MPPHTRRGGRLRILASGPLNTTGLPSLPPELLHEIISYLSSTPIPCLDWHVLSSNYLERSSTLRALSQTCKRFRSVFLALAWEHVEVCASPKVSPLYKFKTRTWPATDSRFRLWSSQLAMDFARELVRQTEIITIRNPVLALFVRTFSVVLSDYSAETLLPEFYRCLSLLPNLETLQVTRAPSSLEKQLRAECLGHTLPSVRTLVLHTNAWPIVKCCPNVERLHLGGVGYHYPSVQEWYQYVPKLRVFVKLPIPWTHISAYVARFPDLVEMPPILVEYCNKMLPLETLRLLLKVGNLQRIDLVADGDRHQQPEVMALVAAAQEVLRQTADLVDGPQKCVTLKDGRGVFKFAI